MRASLKKLAVALSLVIALAAASPAFSSPVGPVTVGSGGNEPVLALAPDGTIYVSALQHLYRSTNGGSSWVATPRPIYASTLNLNSDSSLAVDPGGRLYFTFDWPFAGSTAVCASDDRGSNWSCNPAAVPGVSDRMWIIAPSNSAAYLTTNVGLYITNFYQSLDRGLTWIQSDTSEIFEPQTGPLIPEPSGSRLFQPFDSTTIALSVYSPTPLGATRIDTPVQRSAGLPSLAFTPNGTLYTAGEEANNAGGRKVVIGRSTNFGVSWTKFSIPATNTGTATFSWLAASGDGQIGVLYYFTDANGDPGALSSAVWSVNWAESLDSDTASPTWSLSTVETSVHKGPICWTCGGAARFAGDFINAAYDSSGSAHRVWVKDFGTGGARIRYSHD